MRRSDARRPTRAFSHLHRFSTRSGADRALNVPFGRQWMAAGLMEGRMRVRGVAAGTLASRLCSGAAASRRRRPARYWRTARPRPSTTTARRSASGSSSRSPGSTRTATARWTGSRRTSCARARARRPTRCRRSSIRRRTTRRSVAATRASAWPTGTATTSRPLAAVPRQLLRAAFGDLVDLIVGRVGESRNRTQ